MDKRSDQAKELFLGDYNCAQATFCVFADELKLDKSKALAIASGFGAGLGYQGLTCGVVTGAYMAIGLYNGSKFSDPETVKNNSYAMIKKFNQEFEKRHGALACKELIGADLSTPEGVAQGKSSGVFTTKCPGFVVSAVEIVEQLIQ